MEVARDFSGGDTDRHFITSEERNSKEDLTMIETYCTAMCKGSKLEPLKVVVVFTVARDIAACRDWLSDIQLIKSGFKFGLQSWC